MNVEISKVAVAVRGEQEYLEAMTFTDQNDKEILSFRGENVRGTWSELVLNKNEHIVGIQANMCEKYVRGIGFYVWKLGLGIPIVDKEEEKLDETL